MQQHPWLAVPLGPQHAKRLFGLDQAIADVSERGFFHHVEDHRRLATGNRAHDLVSEDKFVGDHDATRTAMRVCSSCMSINTQRRSAA